MENKTDTEIKKLNAFIIYEITGEPEVQFKVNEKTDLEQIFKPQIYKFPFDQNVRVYCFPLPERNFLKEKNQVIFEISYSPLPLITANYFSAKYSFQLRDPFNYYFMIGLKFLRNDKHSYYKEPPGKPIDDEILEFYYFYIYICNMHIESYGDIMVKEESAELQEKIQTLHETTMKKLIDLIEIFKMTNRGGITSFPRATIQFFRLLDDFILTITENEDYPELFLFTVTMVGIFPYDHFMNRDYSLKQASILLHKASKVSPEYFLRYESFQPLRFQLMNGFYVLTNFAIKEGSGGWLNLLSSKAYEILFEEQSFYLRINEFIRRSGSCMKDRDNFNKAKNFLIKNYNEREKDLKNPQQSFNAILRNIAILSVNKENLLDTLIEFYENDLIDTEKLRSIKEEIRRKKWQSEDEANFAVYVEKLKFIIDSLEKKIRVEENENEAKPNNEMVIEEINQKEKEDKDNKQGRGLNQIQGHYGGYSGNFGGVNQFATGANNNSRNTKFSYSTQLLCNEFKNLLYDLSYSIRYIFTLMKFFKYENLEIYMIKRAINSVYDLALDDYSFILNELEHIPEEIKKEIIDGGFYERIKYTLKKVLLPFDEKSKNGLRNLLLNKDLFHSANGSLEFTKEFIRNKPNVEDLMFIIRELILPQKLTCENEFYREIFIYIKNYLMSNINEIFDLITCFSNVIGMLDAEADKDNKLVICEDFWKTINQRYSPEVFLGLSQIFNEKEDNTLNQTGKKNEKIETKLDQVIETSYIQYVKSIIESINTDIQNFDKINQFFNSLSISAYVNDHSDQKERVVFSNNSSTEKIILSILDILEKVSNPEHMSRTVILENPSKENFWYKLIKSKGKYISFINHNYVIAIINQVISIYEGFAKGTLPVFDYITVSKQSVNLKDTLVSYFSAVVKNQSYKELKEMVEMKVKSLEDNLNIITDIETFLNHFGKKVDRAEEISLFLRKIKINFKTTPFREFVLPEDILSMKGDIKLINRWSETVIFNNIMNFHLFETLNKEKEQRLFNHEIPILDDNIEPDTFIGDFERDLTNPNDIGPVFKTKKYSLTLQELFDLATVSAKEIKLVMANMITAKDFSSLSLANTMKYFKGLGQSNSIDDYVKESELIGEQLLLKTNEVDVLKRILKTFCEISIFIKFCSIMLKLDSVFKFSLNNINKYKEFMDLIDNPKNSFDKIFEASQKITEIRSKYLMKYDIENIFFELAENKELLDFLLNTPDEDIRNMVDAVDEHGDSFIRVQTIRDLLIIGSFVRGMKLKEFTSERQNNPVEEEFVNRIITNVSDNNSYQNIDALINSCGKQFLGIKHLHNELSNREEASKIKAKEICKDSYFDFNFTHYKKTYEVSVSYGKALKKISFRDLCDLRDRVLLLLYNEKEEILEGDNDGNSGSGMIVDNTVNIPLANKENIRQILSAFIKVVDISEKVIFILNDIYINGYPIFINKQIRLKEGNPVPFVEVLENISTINSQWNEDLKEAYTMYYPLTYFNGNQFWQLESVLSSNKKNVEKSYGFYLLKYADPGLDVISEINKNKLTLISNPSEQNGLTPKERIFKLGESLVKLIDPNRNGSKSINFKKLHKMTLNLKGSHFIFSNPSTLRIYHHLLSIHFSIENSLPATNQLFYCTRKTTFHEIISFLYRFVYCPVARLFTIVRVENLSFELQNFLVEQVNKIMKQQNTSNVSLIPYLCLISSDSSSFINTQFAENPYIYQLRDFDVLDESSISTILKSLNLNATTVRSDDTGAGKTYYIRKRAEYSNELEGTHYINFPILDSIEIDKLSERLYELNQYSNRKFIHMTVCGIIDDFEMLDYILFKFIIIGCFKNDIFVSFRNRDEPIFIEISNTFNDYLYNAISILPLLPNEELIISGDILSTINMGKYVFDPIQIVCNYLYQYDQNQINSLDLNPAKNVNTRMFTKEEGLNLLNKYFIKNNPNCTFRQIQIFISILADQLNKFSHNFYFACENIKFIQDNSLADVRARIMSSLLLMTEEFTTRSIKAARDSQNITSLNLKRSITRENVNQDDARIDEINSLSSVMSWSQSNHLLIMFHEDGYCMTPVYREKSEVPPSVKQLVESQKSILGDYQRMTHTELLTKLISIVGGYYLEEMFIDSNYVMTADNFLKMLLIIIRARCNVPIVIMGETGCGKTSLVRFLATRILNEGFEVINFHAGIKESHIIERMNEIKQKAYEFVEGRIWVFLDEINTCDCLGLITEIITQNLVQGEPLPYNIVFIAACNPYKIRKDTGEVGLIKQRIATKLVYRVHPLPDSLIDYVWDYGSLSENEEKLYIGNILQNITGDLKNIAIDLVIKSQVFIRNCEDKYAVSLRDVARFKTLHQWFYKIIEEKNEKDADQNQNKAGNKDSQSIRGHGGYYPSYYAPYQSSYAPYQSNYGYGFNSYASYGGGSHFYSYSSANPYYYSTHIKYTGKLMIARKALILSLLLCYYNRISKNSDRSEYKKIITRFLSISEGELEEMINEEQRDIVTRMELPPAIAINKALLENVFTLLVCVINKIPLFICGKPGCSKSLAVQLLVSNLRGQDSTDKFFKNLPRILAIPYQGSESSTSEGIEKIFEKANNVLKNADKAILPLIVFDEIGLAEISKNNPLKILHSLLEPENPVIAFVGISNWRLDASKMNRAVYLARPDPDLEDLESTALSIFEYYIKEPRFDEKSIMKALAKTYYEFKKEQSTHGYTDFHGTRDFYSLIKQVTRLFNEQHNNYNEVKYSIVKDALSRNFGGLQTSISSIHSLFVKNLNLLPSDFAEIPQKSLMELVKENLRDRDSRFLLLFTNGESASYILDNYLKNDLKERVFIIGSEFEGDKDKEEHSFRLLSDIILYMESGSSIILKNLDQIYGSLYDLFNQNFMIVGQKKNCRIALGSTNNPMCFVHNNFHCIVLVDIKDLNRMDPPFLNRFEKQVLTFESVLTLRQRNIVVELNKWIKSLTTIAALNDGNMEVNESNKKNNLAISDMIITYNEEFCPTLTLAHYSEEKSNEEIIETCKKDILSVSNISLVVFSVLSEMYQNSRDEILKIHKIYFDEQYHDSLSQYVNHVLVDSDNFIKNLQTSKLIVYTHSNILDEIKFINYKEKQDINYSVISLAEIKTEKDFDHRFKMFLTNKESEWLFIKIDMVKEKNHIPMIKFKTDKFLNEYRRGVGMNELKLSKNVVMIIYLSRTKSKFNEEENIKKHEQVGKLESHFLSGWNQVMIDCINGGQIDNLKSLLDLSTIEVVKSNLDSKTISEMVFNIYLKFNFIPYNDKDSVLVKEYMTDMIRKIENDNEIFEMIIKKCLEFLNDKSLPDWKIKICCDNKILSKSLNTFNAIKLLIADLIEEPLLKIIHFLESESALYSFFGKERAEEDINHIEKSGNKADETRRKIWRDLFEKKDLNQLYPYNVIQSLIINPVFGLLFPFSKVDIYEMSLALKDTIDNIYVLDNALYNANTNNRDEILNENNMILSGEIEKMKSILKGSIVNKILSNSSSILSLNSIDERSLQTSYMLDILNYFVTVELKKQTDWQNCLMIIVDKFIGLDYDTLENIFIFLWKNKKLLDSIFNIFDTISSTNNNTDYMLMEKILEKSELYNLNFNNCFNNRRSAEINLFLGIYKEIAKIILNTLNNYESSMIKSKNFGLVLNSYITSLINFSLEIKEYPHMLNLFIIINEYLKILSLIFDNNPTEIGKRVSNVFFAKNEEDLHAMKNSELKSVVNDKTLDELREYKFLSQILLIIDTECKSRMKKIGDEADPLIDILYTEKYNLLPEIDEFTESIINSKLTIFENVLIGDSASVSIKTHIVNNIVKDANLIKYSSMIFFRLFRDYNIDETFSELVRENNLKEIIEKAMDLHKINSFDHIFFSFLSDFLRKFLTRPAYQKKNYFLLLRDYLEINFINYQRYLGFLCHKSKFINIIGFAGMKNYLEVFGEYLVETLSNEKDAELISKINAEIENQERSGFQLNNQIIEMIKIYILKSMMKRFGCNAQSLAKVKFHEMGIKWINNKQFENNDNLLGIELCLPGLESLNNEYSALFNSLLNEDNEDSITCFKQLIVKASLNYPDSNSNSLSSMVVSSTSKNEKKSFELRLLIIQFFINKVYLSFSNPKFEKSLTFNHIVGIFEKCTKELRESLGDDIYNFIYKLVYNFANKNKNKAESFFRITSRTEINKIGTLGFLMQSFNILLSSVGEVAKLIPYCQLFKTEDTIKITDNITILDTAYLPGGFVEFHDENLMVMMKHINESFELYGTQLGLYECSCGYLYTIGDCTRPYYTANCPNCKSVIGGASHVLSERAGHICHINADNKNDANRKQIVLESLSKKLINKPGYISKMPDELPLQYSLRKTTPVGFRWFNLLNHGILYLMIELENIQDNQFRNMLQNIKIKNYMGEDYLKAHINSDISKLDELVKIKDHYIFLILVLNGLFTTINYNQTQTFDLLKPEDRENFESSIQQKFISPKFDDVANEIQSYKHKFSLDKKLSYGKILDENFTNEDISEHPLKDYMRIFRTTNLGDWNDLKSEYMKISSTANKNFQFLKILIEKFDEMTLLSNLFPIIQFTNYMINLCNYRLTRQEAKEKKIKDIIEGNSVAEKLFLEFSSAWSKVAFKCTQHACKSLPVLDKIDMEMPVSFVLIDDRELGYGMYMAAAFQYLGQIQNEILEAIVYLIRENNNYQLWGNMDIHKYSIQKISSHEIIMYQTDADFVTNTTNLFSKFYEIYNPNFGQGSIVEYNFEKIEYELAFKLLTNKKLLNFEDIVKIQYKFELLSINNNNSNLLNNIKSKIDQRIIIGEESHVIKKTLEKLEQQNVAYIHQIFSSLEVILCNLKYSNNVENCLISTYIQRIQNAEKISFFLKEMQPLCSVRLSNIISFYEIIEERLFKHVVDYVSPEYKTILDEHIKKQLNSYFTNSTNQTNRSKYPSYENIINVIQRFVIRCLVASIEPKFPIKEYLMRTDFWDLDVREEIVDNFYSDFPDEILIANTLPLLDYIIDCRKARIDEQKKEKIDFTENKGKIDLIRMENSKKKDKFI